jgi:triacylglycerol lipase
VKETWRKVTLRIAAAVLAAGVAALAVAVYVAPVAVGRGLLRFQLELTGYDRVSLAGPGGEVMYFRGGRPVSGHPVVVLIHGLADQAGSWGQTAAALKPDYRVLIPDLPGHGGSGPAEGPLTLRGAVEAVAAVIDREAPGRPVALVGNSLGGWVALTYTLENPRRVARLVLVGSAGLWSTLEGVDLSPDDRAEAYRMVAAVLGRWEAERLPGFILDDVVRRAEDGPVSRFFPHLRSEDLVGPRLGEIDLPVELVWGDQDGLFPLEYARRLEAGLCRARLHVLEGCAHTPQITCSQRFNRLLLELLAEGPP